MKSGKYYDIRLGINDRENVKTSFLFLKKAVSTASERINPGRGTFPWLWQFEIAPSTRSYFVTQN